MGFAEYWYGEVMERVYTTATDFHNWDSWKSVDVISDSSSSWKTLDLPDLDDKFKVAMVKLAKEDDLGYHVVIFRPMMRSKFGENPTVSTKITIKHKENVVDQDKQGHVAWYKEVSAKAEKPRTRVENTSNEAGYQLHTFFVETSKRQAVRQESNIILELEIRIINDSDRYDCRNDDERTLHFQRCLSQNLNQPYYGNVEFYQQAKPNGRKLYAFSHFWEYPIFSDCCLNFRMPDEGQPEPEHLPSGITSSSDGSNASLPLPKRRLIPIPYNFDLFSLALRYIYTNSLCFTTSPDLCKDPVIPTTTDAEGLYRIAVDLKLEALRTKAFHFLRATCNINNVTFRTFSPFAYEYREVRQVYLDYLLKHWDTVVDSADFAESSASQGVTPDFLQLVRQAKYGGRPNSGGLI